MIIFMYELISEPLVGFEPFNLAGYTQAEAVTTEVNCWDLLAAVR